MGVSINMPGRAPATGGALASLVDAGVNVFHGVKQGQIQDQEIQAKTLANQRAEGAYKQATNPDSTASEFARQSAMADLGTIAKSTAAQNPDTAHGLARISDMIKNGVMEKNPESGQIERRQLNALEVNTVYSENPFVKTMHDQMNAQVRADAMAPLNQAKISMAKTMEGRLEETRNQNAAEAGDKFEKDPIIKSSKTSLNSLARSSSILNNTDKPVTNKDLNLAYNDYINAVANGGAATEGKINRELPDTFEQQWNELQQKFGKNADLRQSPEGRELIGLLQKNISTVNGDLAQAIAIQAKNVGASYDTNTNPKVRAVVKGKVGSYTAPAQTEKPSGSPQTDVSKMSREEKIKFLKDGG